MSSTVYFDKSELKATINYYTFIKYYNFIKTKVQKQYQSVLNFKSYVLAYNLHCKTSFKFYKF